MLVSEMIPKTHRDFLDSVVLDRKYMHPIRWIQYDNVIKLVLEMDSPPKSIIEVGSHVFPLFKDSFRVEKDVGKIKPHLVWDITNTPLPIEDKAFDLFISLQVWEHLEGKQQVAFKEVMRISRSAILGFPLHWKNVPKEDCHYNITEEIISEWTLGHKYEKKVITEDRDNYTKIAYVYKF